MSTGSRMKRAAPTSSPSRSGLWDCSVCTYKNSREAFKCRMCDTRKGTSTRKPRLSTQVVEVQQHIQQVIVSAARGEPGGSGSGSITTEKNNEHSFTSSEASEAGSSPAILSSSVDAVSKKQLKRSKSFDGDDSSNASSSMLAATSLGTKNSSNVTKTTKKVSGMKQRRSFAKPPKLRNIDRSTARHMPVTVNGVTVIITDFKPRQKVANSVDKPVVIKSTSSSLPPPPAAATTPATAVAESSSPAALPSSASDSTRSPSPATGTASAPTSNTNSDPAAFVSPAVPPLAPPRPPVTAPAPALPASVQEGSLSDGDSNS